MKIRLFYFSPTGTSAKVAGLISEEARKVLGAPVEKVDLTKPANRGIERNFEPEDLLIICSPVHEGRVPAMVLTEMNLMKGSGNPAIAAMVYGNRDFDDAMREMKDSLNNAGFVLSAAALFIGEHAFNTNVAKGRPDAEDELAIREFGRKAAEKISAGGAEVDVPGNFPYKAPMLNLNICPETSDACTDCMICVELCPTGAIDGSDPRLVSVERCIMCNACVKGCPENAKAFVNEQVQKIVSWLERKFSERKPVITIL